MRIDEFESLKAGDQVYPKIRDASNEHFSGNHIFTVNHVAKTAHFTVISFTYTNSEGKLKGLLLTAPESWKIDRYEKDEKFLRDLYKGGDA